MTYSYEWIAHVRGTAADRRRKSERNGIARSDDVLLLCTRDARYYADTLANRFRFRRVSESHDGRGRAYFTTGRSDPVSSRPDRSSLA